MATPTIQSNGQYTPTVTNPNATIGATPTGVNTTVPTGTNVPGFVPGVIPGYVQGAQYPFPGVNSPIAPTFYNPNFFNPNYVNPSLFNTNSFNPFNAYLPSFAQHGVSTVPALWNTTPWNSVQTPWGYNPWTSSFYGATQYPAFNGVSGLNWNNFSNQSNPFTSNTLPFGVHTHAWNGINPAFQGTSPVTGMPGVFGQTWNSPTNWINHLASTPAWWNATQNPIGTVPGLQNYGPQSAYALQNFYPQTWNTPSLWNNTQAFGVAAPWNTVPFNSTFPFNSSVPISTPFNGQYTGQFNTLNSQFAQQYALQNYLQNCGLFGGDCVCTPGNCYGVQNTLPTFGVNNLPFHTPFTSLNAGLNTGFGTGTWFNQPYSSTSPISSLFNSTYGINYPVNTLNSFNPYAGSTQPLVNTYAFQGWTPSFAQNYLSTQAQYVPGYNPFNTFGLNTQGLGVNHFVASTQGFRPYVNTVPGFVGATYPYAFAGQNPSVLSTIAGSTNSVPVTFPYATNANSPFVAGLVQNPFAVTNPVVGGLSNGVTNGVTGTIAQGPSLVGCCREAA